ncbi:rubrerythrin family protein [Candidatus Soleaferrea massiliensis]|uniref:rubrerythrin family protein n=1 Tax=Candidatus Soleaferrea massiliensis TaxID=1470354 RepID=UPI00058EAED3|nr:ferritin family protein [Candidatus Soleaferrea massiliensis]
MDFMKSETIINLARSFAGESQARTRYDMYAIKAKEEGYAYLAYVISQLAANEYAHAKVFFDHINSHAPQIVNNLFIDAGYPYKIRGTMENMQFAAEGEHEEATVIYPKFGQIAEQEGLKEIAVSYNLISKIEAQHNKIFTEIHDQLKNGTAYKKDQPVLWKCSVCGHEHLLTEPWQKCPVCGHPIGFTELQLQELH